MALLTSSMLAFLKYPLQGSAKESAKESAQESAQGSAKESAQGSAQADNWTEMNVHLACFSMWIVPFVVPLLGVVLDQA